ncbi:MAG TPA: peptidoglycan recognition family protein [Phycisphaerales bacterium]|nr:peptidoglycan recognition family protein [Phycisphaerales bacterium]
MSHSELPSNPALESDHSGLLNPTRRGFIAASLGIIAAGCASSSRVAQLPGPDWGHPSPTPTPAAPPATTPTPTPLPGQQLPGYVLARARWSQGDPVPSLMNRMLPVQWITVHHDGMNAFTAVDQISAAQRLESIRRAHRNKGWGDIGYHFAIDRGGRVWQCRPLQWQGAHVKDCNPGNIGVVNLGNFEIQSPSQAQLTALNNHLEYLMRTYNVPVSKIRTHQEWPSARTECPGRSLQAYMVNVRRNGTLA